ncbi:MAG: gliding motility-associated C-terminal domain-containing protein, partial [Bacteroidetes bacterium]|nr:gliding motility-associated C-terminal domain-containing protein [Bacteroidota bacterium]
NPIPSSPAAGTDATYCEGESITDITAPGTNIEWFSDTGLTASLGFGSPFAITPGIDTTTYYVTQTDSGCQSQADSVVIIVNPLPAAPVAEFDTTYCIGDPVAGLTVTGSGSGLLIWYADAALTTIIGNGSPFTPGVTTTDTFYVSEIIVGCSGPADSIIITFNQNPVINTSAMIINLSSCGNADGSVTGIIAAGMPPLTYVWVDGSFNIVGGDSANLVNVPSGLYNLTVTDSNSCSSVSGPHVVTDTTSLLDTNAVFVDSSDCISTTGSITGIILIGGNSPIVYEWVDQSFTVVGDSLDLTGVPAGTYYLTITDADSCQVLVGPYVIANNSAPPAPIAFSPQPICQGDAIADLTATGTGGVFVWYSDIGLTDSIFSGSPFASGAITDTSYWVTETINGCESPSTQVNIIINPTPAAPIAGTDAGYCVGEPIADLFATGLNDIEWFSDAGLTISLGTDTFLTITPGIGTTIYYVTQITTDGCQSPADSVIISVNTSPLAPAVSGGASYCFGDTIADLTVIGGSGTLIWYSDANLTDPIGSGTSFTPNPATDTFYVAETLNGCTGSADMVIISVNASPPAPDASIDTSYCFGDAIADLTATDGAGTLTWYSDANLTDSIGSGTSFTPNPVTDTFYVAETLNGCKGPADTVTVVVHPLPTANAWPDTTICEGDSVNLKSSGGIGYVWNPPSGLDSINVQNPVANPDSTTTWFVTVTDTNGCINYDSVTIYVNLVLVNAYPDTSIYPGESVVLYASDSTNYIYSWTPQKGLDYANIQNPIASPDSTTVYYVNVTDPNNGCTTIDSLTIIIIIDTCKLIIYNGFSPNLDDINDSWEIESNRSCSPDKVKVIIYNRWGDVVWEDEKVDYSKIIWDGTNKNGRPLPDGTYYYIIEITNGIEQQINVTKNGVLLPPFESETILLNGWVQIFR